MNRFDQKTVLITGAASGIGRAAALRFAEEGARLVLVDRNLAGLEETRAALPAGTEATLREVNVADEQAVKALVDDIAASHGGIQVLINNAGTAGNDHSPVTENNTDNWNTILSVNLLGPMFFIRAVAPYMKEQGGGAIVNTASVAGIRSGAGGNAYSASKAGVISLTKTTACDLGGYNIRVNAVCPGLIETGMTKPVFDYARENNKEEKLGSRCELRRYGRPAEIAAAMAFLASDDASYVTGQALAVDGGNTASLNLPGMKV
ncbi:short-chain dehydrogenase/reductase SDR [Alcanivorax xiamenensis]|uniref:Short-chain dehydrogenase/reductase SDR n=1 Tax=Alcanivorax xiamenensis TaxID=1177156 RepID=A0ABQ6Y9Y7_9GAMM|nr:SDR family NAD(P)-dependent oxidoreductase [Alcanivorax xiamenensis]KAF0806192.1 short-chain dehydrogenase/reductase SDR [Alcanivorax xiamenensis]